MTKQEAKEHTKVEAWMRHELRKGHAVAVELKHSRGKDSLAFAELKPRQKAKLSAFGNPFVWKIDDAGYREKPFDIIGTPYGFAYVAVRFPSCIPIITILDWMLEEESSQRRSLTERRAREIAHAIIEI
jgi:hypothetical protein